MGCRLKTVGQVLVYCACLLFLPIFFGQALLGIDGSSSAEAEILRQFGYALGIDAAAAVIGLTFSFVGSKLEG